MGVRSVPKGTGKGGRASNVGKNGGGRRWDRCVWLFTLGEFLPMLKAGLYHIDLHWYLYVPRCHHPLHRTYFLQQCSGHTLYQHTSTVVWNYLEQPRTLRYHDDDFAFTLSWYYSLCRT